jgi:hypothetical protein
VRFCRRIHDRLWAYTPGGSVRRLADAAPNWKY